MEQNDNTHSVEYDVDGSNMNLHVETENSCRISLFVRSAGDAFVLVDSQFGPVLDEIYNNGGFPATVRVVVEDCSQVPSIYINQNLVYGGPV